MAFGMMTWPAIIDHMCTIVANFSSLPYRNFINVDTNRAKCLPIMQSLIGFFLQITEMGYYDYS